METDVFAAELAAERAATERIDAAHRDHIASARRYATGLADEASFLSEEGPRETEAESGDEDGEAAAEAGTARAAAGRAVLAWKRVRELEAAGDALAFGRISGDDDDPMYIGRMSVTDSDDVLLVDWRAPVAEPFYRATPLEPLGVEHRRHLHYLDSTLVDYSDELFDTTNLDDRVALRGEAALLATLAARRDGRMQSVVATIQAEQDAIIRASAKGPLLVQGGPGTGKTVVALHRAAYLLYADRAALAETGVLIVGPSPDFLTYISGVLPSLGESGVVSVTADQLYAGVKLDPDGSPDATELKGRASMVKLLSAAVADRQRFPDAPLVAWYGSRRLQVESTLLQHHFGLAQRRTTHNAGAGALRTLLIEHLVGEVHEPGFGEASEVRSSIESSPDIRRYLERHWPVLSPEQVLNDLFGSTSLLRSAALAAGLDDAERSLLERERAPEAELWRRRWERSDVPLLDELLHLLGDVNEALEADVDMEHVIADSDDVFTLAESQDLNGEDLDDDDEELVLDETGERSGADRDIESYDAWREGDEEATWR
ncbi:MAG: UvrD-helicase domain-containing protein [Acidimicrobiales bacterium]